MGRFATGSLRRRIRARRDARAKKRYAGGMWTCRGSIRKSPSTNPSWPRGDPTRGEDRHLRFSLRRGANRRDDTHAAFVASRSRATLTSHQSRRTHRQTTLVVVASLLALAALAPALGLGTVGALVRGDRKERSVPHRLGNPRRLVGRFSGGGVRGWRTPETSANAGGAQLGLADGGRREQPRALDFITRGCCTRSRCTSAAAARCDDFFTVPRPRRRCRRRCGCPRTWRARRSWPPRSSP